MTAEVGSQTCPECGVDVPVEARPALGIVGRGGDFAVRLTAPHVCGEGREDSDAEIVALRPS